MKPSPHPRQRVQKKRMWGVLNYGRLMNVSFRRKDAIGEIVPRERWKELRGSGALECVPVLVTWKRPTRRKGK